VKKQRTKAIPPEYLIRAALEATLSALRENHPVPKEAIKLQAFLGRMFSDLLNRLYASLAESDFNHCAERADLTSDEHAALLLWYAEPTPTLKEVAERLNESENRVRRSLFRGQSKMLRVQSPINEAINEVIAYDAKAANVISQLLDRVKRLREENPSGFKVATDFKGRVNEAVDLGKQLRSKGENFESKFALIAKDPIRGLYKQLEFLVLENRLHRRYMRARFGLKEREVRRAIFKRTRRAKGERSFWNWWNKNGRARSNQSPEFESDWLRFRDGLLRKEALLRYAQERLISLQTLQLIWQNTIFQSFGSLWEKNDGPGIDTTEFSLDILNRMKPLLKDFHQIQLASSLKLKREFSANYEDELVKLSAWAANNLSLNLNQGARHALKAEGRPLSEALLESLSANILLVLSEGMPEGFFSSGSGKRSVLSSLAQMLRDEQPLDSHHAEILQNRLRKAKQTNSSGSELAPSRKSPRLPDAVAANQVDDSLLRREEARIDLDRLISQANLTPSEIEVLELNRRDLTDKEIAWQLGKAVGTVKPLLFRAKKKLRHAASNSTS
jgi:DNA-binding NarL/FixJ family response regulator